MVSSACPPLRTTRHSAARRCVYCDFAVSVDPDAGVDVWVEALRRELELLEYDEAFRLSGRLETLYVGGGTPSLLGSDAMARLGAELGSERLSAPGLEWTSEANPESFTPEVAGAWRRSGVNRVSLGLQSFHEPTLRWMGRLHGPQGSVEAVGVAKANGFDNISVDLIFALPSKLDRSWRADLERVLDLDVPHVSLYGLGVEPRTALGRAVAEGREAPVDDLQYREEYLEAAECLRSAGYEHYEVSNFARAGAMSRHNSAYWDGRSYVGIGNGAHSYRHPVRRWNVREWETYRGRLLRGEPPEEGREKLSESQARLEQIWLKLRTKFGLELDALGGEARVLVRTWERAGPRGGDGHVGPVDGARLVGARRFGSGTGERLGDRGGAVTPRAGRVTRLTRPERIFDLRT